jgi:predicted hydrocarbon binding protein
MDRKAFLQKSLFAGAACAWGAGLVSVPKSFGQGAAKTGDPAEGFRNEWVKSFLKNLDAGFDEAGRIRMMESCGRDCARRGATRMAESFKGNVDGMITELSAQLGKENIKREGRMVTLVYPECYCPMVSRITERLSDTWCNCSRGWVLEIFGIAAGKPVEAKLVQSIKRGDPLCKFEITV